MSRFVNLQIDSRGFKTVTIAAKDFQPGLKRKVIYYRKKTSHIDAQWAAAKRKLLQRITVARSELHNGKYGKLKD